MFRNTLLSSLILFGLVSTQTLAQHTNRPNVLVPNGFQVNSYTGNLYQSRTDLKIPGQGLPLDITFSYNISRRNKNWGFGKGWTFTYSMAYAVDTAGIRIDRPDGKRDLFRKSGATYISPTGVFDMLVEYQPGKFYLQTKDNIRYYFDNAAHKRLTKLQDTKGNAINLAYNDSLLNTLTDGAGHNLGFTWTNGRLTKIADNSCQPTRTVSYEYDSKGNPTKVTNPLGDFVRYYYDSTARVTGYTDEGGNNMSIQYNTNSAVIRIASCATTHLFTYVPAQRKTYVTEKVNGQSVVTSYTYDTQGRLASKKGNCCGYNLDYAYDSQSNISSKRDGNNKETKYEFDNRGNVVKEIDPAGYLNTYAYDPSHNKVIRFQDKNGDVATYQYDANANLIQINKPLSVTQKYTYDAKGNKLTETDPNGNITAYEYNENGYLTKITNAEGGVTKYAYDCRGNRLSMTDPRNGTTMYEYNVQDQLVKMTNSLNQVTSYTYDKVGNLVAMTNALGKTTTYAYDGLKRRISTILPMGNTTLIAYDEQGNISKETNANGNSTTYTYNNRKQPLTITDALGNSITYSYDEAGNRLTETDKRGNTTRFEYDDQYRLTKRVDALGNAFAFSYDPVGNRTTELDANGNAMTFQYDALKRIIKITDAQNRSIESTYDKNSNLLTEKDKNGNVTTYLYDKLNRLKTITNSLNGAINYTYDANGNRLTEKDQLDRTSTHTYNALNQRLTTTNALNEVTTYTYNAVGNIRTMLQPNGNTITNTFDDNNQLLSVTDAIGAVIAYTYDRQGNIVSESNGIGHTTSHQYDALNHIIKTTFPNTTTFQFQYDANGNKLKEINQKGFITSFVYDNLNRVTGITDALGHPNRFAYDAMGNLATITDAKGNPTTYTYDSRNNLVKQTYADGSSRTLSYDSNGLIASRTDSKGIVTQYKYDKLNRLTERVYPGAVSERFSYDAIGQMLTAINVNATVTYSYDALGRLLREDLNGRAITYEYNTAAKTHKKNYAGGVQLVLQLDGRHRLSDIKESNTSLANFQYDAANQHTGLQFRNGVATAYSYDNMGNLTSLVTTPSTLVNMVFKYDAADKRIMTERLQRPTYSEQYGYDNVFQINSFVSGQSTNGTITPSITHQFTYDALGNRLTAKENVVNKNYVVNNLNQYTSINTNGINAPPTYDKTGNLLKDEANTYAYDYENRLTSTQNSNGTVVYKYDALGRRISRTVGATETRYFYDQNNIIEQQTGSIIKSFVYGAYIDQILFAKTGTSSYYYHTDNQNSVQALTDGAGNLVEQYTYDPFGTPHVFSPANVELSASSINTILYNGREYDFLTKTYNYRFREMNPTLGRFAQRDPLEYIDGLNNYAYVNNNAINDTDPMGLVNWGGVATSVGGLIGSGFGAFAGVALSGTGAGAVIGLPLAGISGYEFAQNAGNLWDALNDREPSNSGSAASDAANWWDPCNKGLRRAAEWFDITKSFIGPPAKAAGKVASEAGSLLDDLAKSGTNSGLLDDVGRGAVESAKQGTNRAQELGRAGEEAVGVSGPKTRIPSLTETAKYRIPDQLTSNTLSEVKNVNRLGMTNQIRDFYLYSQETGREFVIYTRPNGGTTLSRPLQGLVNDGSITVKPIPFK